MPYLRMNSEVPPVQSLAVASESIRVGRMRSNATNIIDHGIRPKLSKLPIGQNMNRTKYRLTEDDKTMWVTTATEFPDKQKHIKTVGQLDKKVSKPPKLATIPEEPEAEQACALELLQSADFINAVELQSGAQAANAVRECLMNRQSEADSSKWCRKSLRRLQEVTGPDTVTPIDNAQALHRVRSSVGGSHFFKSKKEIGALNNKKKPFSPKEQLRKENAVGMETIMNDGKMSLSTCDAIKDLNAMKDTQSKSSSSTEYSNDISVIYENDDFKLSTETTTSQSDGYFAIEKKKKCRKKQYKSRSKFRENANIEPKIVTGGDYSVTTQSTTDTEKSHANDLNNKKNMLKPLKIMQNILFGQGDDSLDTPTKPKDNGAEQIEASLQFADRSKSNDKFNCLKLFQSKRTVSYLVWAPTICVLAILFLALALCVRFIFVEPDPPYWQKLLKFIYQKLMKI
ncbi:uncharacterized protein LOC111082061 isoform X2 [Drosophila obscura]|uniref:uncharacterized protein LOC111082061 isoform X2 n=1 Tax=Drosophila obscura TaxID=7282 RepID=UPI001BB1C96B|nr:uncharacterized protein LOC111082061 isoform X2 [Drosophila obscura]